MHTSQAILPGTSTLLLRFNSTYVRIRFYGQDIVLFRENIVNRMRRHCIKPPKDGDDINTITGHVCFFSLSTSLTSALQLVKTLLDEAHLCPLNISVRPVFWNYDHAMYLYPLPDTVIISLTIATKIYVYRLFWLISMISTNTYMTAVWLLILAPLQQISPSLHIDQLPKKSSSHE